MIKISEEVQKIIKKVKLLNIDEGDVISFADYKNKKYGIDNTSVVQDNPIKDTKEDVILIKINSVKIEWCEGPIDFPYFKGGDIYSYEDFQKRVYAIDTMLQNDLGYAKLKYTANITIYGDGQENTTYTGRIDLGDGKDYANLMENMKYFISDETGSQVYFENKPVEYNEAEYQNIIKEFDHLKREPEETPAEKALKAPYIKDYSNGGTKKPEDVEVGDILTRTWGL